ncbi:MAG: class I adenylate-forming enzyme family protein [Sphingobium sp.]
MATSISWITDAAAGQFPLVAPDRPAIAIDDGAPLTYGELRELELRYATSLQRAGVGRGDRVALILRNSLDYVALFLAIARLGAISVRVNFRLTGPEISFIVKDSGSKIIVFDEDLQESVASVRQNLDVETYVMRDGAQGGKDSAPSWAVPMSVFMGEATDGSFPQFDSNFPATILYTSGTTGTPKGSVWTHANILWFSTIQAMKWKFDPETVAMTSGPLFHAGALEVLILPALMRHGRAVIFSSGGFSVEHLLHVSKVQQATCMLAFSFMVHDMLKLPDLESRISSVLTRIHTGGDAVMPWVYPEFEKRLPQVEVVQQYGLTEGGAVSTCLDHADAVGRTHTVGRPLPLTDVKVVTEEGRPAQPGELGEIYVRSPGVSGIYWGRPNATQETFQDGWCRTGDLGQVDPEGFLILAGRAKDMIRSGAENVYPAEVEAVLTKAPMVADAAVFGVPHPKFQEVGCCALVAENGKSIEIEKVKEYCEARLAKYKVPKHFVVLDLIPRTTSGKVQKYILKDRYKDIFSQTIG